MREWFLIRNDNEDAEVMYLVSGNADSSLWDADAANAKRLDMTKALQLKFDFNARGQSVIAFRGC